MITEPVVGRALPFVDEDGRNGLALTGITMDDIGEYHSKSQRHQRSTSWGYSVCDGYLYVELILGDYQSCVEALDAAAKEHGKVRMRGSVMGEARRRLFCSRGWRVIKPVGTYLSHEDRGVAVAYLIERDVP